MAIRIAGILPNVEAINQRFADGVLKYPKGVALWEQPIIIERAWYILRKSNYDSKR